MLCIWHLVQFPSLPQHREASNTWLSGFLLIYQTFRSGGSFWPLWLMPDFMKKLAMVTPHYWANDAMVLIQKGQSLLTQRTDLLALTGFLTLFFALGVFALRRSQSAESFV